METQTIVFAPVCLEWSEWTHWDDLITDLPKGGIHIPKTPGVYEVKFIDTDIRLTIGKTGDLNHRVKAALVRGKARHSAGQRIRKAEDTGQLLVRWAPTDHPAAIEEELHRLYQQKYGCLPKYTLSTR